MGLAPVAAAQGAGRDQQEHGRRLLPLRMAALASGGVQQHQELIRSGAGLSATAARNGVVETRSYPASFGGNYASAGFEFVRALNLPVHAAQAVEEALLLCEAEVCPAGERDLILMGNQLMLQIHESVGHPNELDRVFGHEVDLAGDSFATTDKLNGFQYGSSVVNLVADSTVAGGLDTRGWDDDGVFNFEGGCYAKTINLSAENEPDIYQAIRRDALLENVTVLADGEIDFNDGSKTENTRVSYPIYHIDNIVTPVSKAGHAKKVIFLTADAFGVLPPVSKLTKDQAKYHFLSGFTAKLAGTERGITEPTPTFSSCFGAAFLSLHPTQYAEVLGKRIAASGAEPYLVNTGWNGTGKRISIKATRAIIDAILDGSIEDAEFVQLPYFNLAMPTSLHGVDDVSMLDPRNTYVNAADWDGKAKDLAKRFVDNFVKFTDNDEGKALVAAGPQL